MTTKSTSTKPKSTKTTRSSTAKTKTQAHANTASRKTQPKSTAHHNMFNIEPTNINGRFIACIIGAIAAVALVVVGISFLVNTIQNHGKSSFVVTTGNGEKIETQYLGFNNYTFQLKIPKSFHALTESEIDQLYGKTNTPSYVYANEDNSVSVAVNPTSSKLSNDQIKDHLANTEKILGMNSEILSTNTSNISNHTVASIRFAGSSEYSYMRFFSQEGKLVIISFRCKSNERGTWEPVGKYILESLDFTR